MDAGRGRCRCRARRGRRARPHAEAARDPAQLPGRRAPALHCSSGSAPSCASTSSPPTTRSGPFSRDQRRWVYASAKRENNYFGFGTDNDVENAEGYPIIKHRTFAGPGALTGRHAERGACRCRRPRCSAAARGRRHAFRPASVVNISGMSFGALSSERGRGAQPRGARGRLPAEHRRGRARRRTTATAATSSSRSGRRTSAAATSTARFDLARLKDAGRLGAGPRHRDQAVAGGQARARRHAARRPRSAGRSPRSGASRPAGTAPHPAGTRSSTTSTRCSTSSSWSPTETGLPVGIKSAVGNLEFWDHLVRQMGAARAGGRGVDFVNVDGGEGGTGAAPLVFADSVAYPFRLGFAAGLQPVRAGRAHRRRGLHRRRQARPPRERRRRPSRSASTASRSAARRCWRIGCIQAQRCHTDHCPTGVATQNAGLHARPGPGL